MEENKIFEINPGTYGKVTTNYTVEPKHGEKVEVTKVEYFHVKKVSILNSSNTIRDISCEGISGPSMLYKVIDCPKGRRNIERPLTEQEIEKDKLLHLVDTRKIGANVWKWNWSELVDGKGLFECEWEHPHNEDVFMAMGETIVVILGEEIN